MHNSVHSKLPSIDFTNIKSNDDFTHSIVLLRGFISNYDHHNKLNQLLIIINECDDKSNRKNISIAPDGDFKTVVQLKNDSNLLEFQYCGIHKKITLNFNKTENSQHLLKLYYIVCENHDGRFQTIDNQLNTIGIALKKINLIIGLVQCLYAEMMLKNGFARKTFSFIECQPLYSKLTVDEARNGSAESLWQYHAKEMLCIENDSKRFYKYFGILASTLCMNGEVKGNAALGIGDVALFGSGTLYSWPSVFDEIENCLENDQIVDPMQLMDDSNSRGTFGGCFTTALGSICHEIGHIFDLGHTVNGIMGNDIDYVNRMFIHERFPRNLPKRIVSNCILPENHNQTITKPNRFTSITKNNSFLINYHQRNASELTYLTENCALLLNYHKWFNQFERIPFNIQYNNAKHLVASQWPLALIEFRSRATGMCIKYHRFDIEAKQREYSVSSDFVGREYDLIAIDRYGNIERISTE